MVFTLDLSKMCFDFSNICYATLVKVAKLFVNHATEFEQTVVQVLAHVTVGTSVNNSLRTRSLGVLSSHT